MTISTRSCVSARSGAESQIKLMQVARPAPPIRTSATSRWNFASAAAAIAHAPPNIHNRPNMGSINVSGTGPRLYPKRRKGSVPAKSAARMTRRNWTCSRFVPDQRRRARAASTITASTASNVRRPLSLPMNGGRSVSFSLARKRT